ncbi:hypothetical protein M413DRAFT_67790 [Hebeloma cylindrosporum]|uniref:Carrier domain-containing protein n=1 Tax=Hebeloma cylindrosporum TaxID=76867 RepID=A0A0C3CJV6_HEBCY|nr:hypothetical protein M413DRAFT_67790 [Hebeloma cylindrosporum h7]
MFIPLSVLDTASLPKGSSLGEHLNGSLSRTEIRSLAQCLCSGERPAIHSPDPGRPPLTHDDLRTFVSNFVLPHAADRHPLKQNDRIMVVLPPGPENAVALLALGNYHSCAPVNASCTAIELKDDALRLQAKAIVTSRDIGKRLNLESLRGELACQIFYISGRNSGPPGLFDVFMPEDPDVVISSRPTEPHGLDDISLILHTSGTSGKKKVVRYSLRTLLVGTWCIARSWDLKPDDINLNMMPLFHVGGIMRNLMAPILSGGSSIICGGFDPNMFWSLAVKLQPTWYYAAPTVHHALLSAKPDSVDPSRDLRIRLICNAAGGLLPSLASELKAVFGAVVLPSYGMTEQVCMPIATPSVDYQLDRPGCSGIACGPYVSIRGTHDIEHELATGGMGAICVRGLPTFDGYELSPEIGSALDRSAFSSEGWFDSGDVGYLDEDGYLFITGRSKEIINKGGEVISPFEVEEAIVTAAKDYVKFALAFSVEHDVLQEAIGVVIVSEESRSRISLQQLHDLLRGHLHPSKWPFAVVYMDDVPKNSAGKPLRIGLSKRFGIGTLSDDVPILHRHFEAALPANQHLISEPIPCTRVSICDDNVESVLRNIPGVDDVALRRRVDESLAANVSVAPRSKLVVRDITTFVVLLVPGYAVPNHICLIRGPLARDLSGNYDYDKMEKQSLDDEAIDLDEQQLLVRGIFADILGVDPTQMQKDSDFFLLGGNSLLLGKLSYHLRRQLGINIGVADLFAESTIQGIATLIEQESDMDRGTGHDTKQNATTANSSSTVLSTEYDFENDPEYAGKGRGRSQNHPLCLAVQAIPFVGFYPFKTALTWFCMLMILSYFAAPTAGSFWHRLVALFTAILFARVVVRTVCPIIAIAFKWIIIGRYQPGTYRMWSIYYLSWWIVNQSLRIAGRGIFSLHPSLTVLYYRLLGASIGRDVCIDDRTRLYECDLIALQDGCHLDTATLRGFCIERDGYFRLEPITIGRRAFVNTYTSISPGFHVPDGSVYGPHTSSYDAPSPKSFAAYNRTLLKEPRLFLKVFVAWPIIAFVVFFSYIPWMLAIFAMVDLTHIQRQDLNDLEDVIYWFASPKRVAFHALSRAVRALFTPLIQLAFGILVKRALGLNSEHNTSTSRIVLLRRYISSILLSHEALKEAFSILGTHYEMVSIVYRAMGAKVGRRVYWPGSGIYCPDPELLEVGDDVVFGSRSVFITTDRQGSGKIAIENGAMIADRVVLLPGTRVGVRAVMGAGALGRRNGTYGAGSTWIGNHKGEAICLNMGPKEPTPGSDTITPFGKAFYMKEAPFFVFPYAMIVFISATMTMFSALYWSISAVGSAQVLRHLQIHLRHFDLFAPRWYRFGILYAIIAMCFMVILTFQGIISVLWVITTKWALMGRRTPGRYDWDQSSYCQRWQLHLIFSRLMFKGFGSGGVLAPLTGSAYIVWYFRALGANIGKNCGLWVGGNPGLMTEPDLIEIGDDVNLDDCSVVAHLNSRGRFSLNRLKIGSQCAMRSGSRLLSGASMEDNSMLCEHTLLTSGDVADSGVAYAGWPAKRLNITAAKKLDNERLMQPSLLICSICRHFPRNSTVNECGHMFCEA